MNNNKFNHVVFCSNRWFSAISDYCLQLMHALHNDNQSLFVSQKNSMLAKKCLEQGFSCLELPLWPQSLLGIWRCFGGINDILTEHAPQVVWCFEGREHTLCAIHKVFFSQKWKHTNLVRIRGQAAPVKSNLFNKFLYKKLTDKLIYVSKAVLQRNCAAITNDNIKVYPYCRKPPLLKNTSTSFEFFRNAPPIDFSLPLFFILGRYDPVKGHLLALKAFANAQIKQNICTQLVFVGCSENIKAVDLALEAKNLLGYCERVNNRYFIYNENHTKHVYIFDERLSEVDILIQNATFGLIPSLGSEVICRVAVEFLQLGTPVISSDVGSLPEVVSNEVGVVIPNNNCILLQQALEQSVNLYCDESQRYQKLRLQCNKIGIDKYALNNFIDMINYGMEKS